MVQGEAGAASTQRTCWNHLRWVMVHLLAKIPMDCVPKPAVLPKDSETMEDDIKQAPAADPRMLMVLAELASLATSGYIKVAAAAALVQALGCMRYVHLCRSVPIWRTEHLCMFRCYRGKSKGLDGARGAFTWVCPRVWLGRPEKGIFCPADVLWDNWHKFSSALKQAVPEPQEKTFSLLVVQLEDGTVTELSMKQQLDSVKSLLTLALTGGCVDIVSTYSFRRFAPTLADHRTAPWEERMALGGWREQVEQGKKKSMMPVRYSDGRLDSESSVKLAQGVMLTELLTKLGLDATWSATREWIHKNKVPWSQYLERVEVSLTATEIQVALGFKPKTRAGIGSLHYKHDDGSCTLVKEHPEEELRLPGVGEEGTAQEEQTPGQPPAPGPAAPVLPVAKPEPASSSKPPPPWCGPSSGGRPGLRSVGGRRQPA